MEGFNIQALHSLLTNDEDNSDSEDERPSNDMSRMGPADFVPKKSSSESAAPAQQKPATKDIWDTDEVAEGAEYEDIHDTRPQPEYDILYKQAISSEEMFLQMGNKTPATSSCEDMVVKITLPNTKIGDVKLDVKKKFLDVRAPRYKLGLHLPHPCDHENGKAQWDGTKSLLTVTLRMTRDYDFMNF